MKVNNLSDGMLKASFKVSVDNADEIAGKPLVLKVSLPQAIYSLDSIKKCYFAFYDKFSPAPHWAEISMVGEAHTSEESADYIYTGEHIIAQDNRVGPSTVSCITGLPTEMNLKFNLDMTISIAGVEATNSTSLAEVNYVSDYATRISATISQHRGKTAGTILTIMNPLPIANSDRLRIRNALVEEMTSGSTLSFTTPGKTSDCKFFWDTSAGVQTGDGKVTVANNGAYADLFLNRPLNSYHASSSTKVVFTAECNGLSGAANPEGIPTVLAVQMATKVQYGLATNSAVFTSAFLATSFALLASALFFF